VCLACILHTVATLLGDGCASDLLLQQLHDVGGEAGEVIN